MSCGFGATVLLFLLLDHARQEDIQATAYAQDGAQIDLTFFINEGYRQLQQLQQKLAELTGNIKTGQQKISAAHVEIEQANKLIATNEEEQRAEERRISKLKSKIKLQETEEKQRRARFDVSSKQQVASRFVGKSGRQYLSGLKVDGRRVLILVDSSASMLDETIVNVLRRRNMSEAQKLQAPKWQRTLRMIDWLETQMSPTSKFQIYSFNSKSAAVLPETAGTWLRFGEGEQFRKASDTLKKTIPKDGTNLLRAFESIRTLRPIPDNLILLTDSLPTQGSEASQKSTVSGQERLRHFAVARSKLPGKLPVNIILLPMEGGPLAASTYWQLAIQTQGSFIVPASDWP